MVLYCQKDCYYKSLDFCEVLWARSSASVNQNNSIDLELSQFIPTQDLAPRVKGVIEGQNCYWLFFFHTAYLKLLLYITIENWAIWFSPSSESHAKLKALLANHCLYVVIWNSDGILCLQHQITGLLFCMCYCVMWCIRLLRVSETKRWVILQFSTPFIGPN